MSTAVFLAKIQRHWTVFLPRKVAALKAEGRLQEEMLGSARLAQAEYEHLMRDKGYHAHEAEAVAEKNFVYLPPEDPNGDMSEEQKDELEGAEAEYQKAPPVQIG